MLFREASFKPRFLRDLWKIFWPFLFFGTLLCLKSIDYSTSNLFLPPLIKEWKAICLGERDEFLYYFSDNTEISGTVLKPSCLTAINKSKHIYLLSELSIKLKLVQQNKPYQVFMHFAESSGVYEK